MFFKLTSDFVIIFINWIFTCRVKARTKLFYVWHDNKSEWSSINKLFSFYSISSNFPKFKACPLSFELWSKVKCFLHCLKIISLSFRLKIIANASKWVTCDFFFVTDLTFLLFHYRQLLVFTLLLQQTKWKERRSLKAEHSSSFYWPLSQITIRERNGKLCQVYKWNGEEERKVFFCVLMGVKGCHAMLKKQILIKIIKCSTKSFRSRNLIRLMTTVFCCCLKSTCFTSFSCYYFVNMVKESGI